MENLYLTEKLLGAMLTNIFPGVEIIHNKIFRPHRFRPDYYLPSKNIVIEFDGYHHYTQSNIIISDRNKDFILAEEGINVIRIPYFIQIDSTIIKDLFGVDYIIDNPYPHGFIDDKALLPADFCSMGVDRFINDLNTYKNQKDDIIKSLHTQIINRGTADAVIVEKLKPYMSYKQ